MAAITRSSGLWCDLLPLDLVSCVVALARRALGHIRLPVRLSGVARHLGIVAVGLAVGSRIAPLRRGCACLPVHLVDRARCAGVCAFRLAIGPRISPLGCGISPGRSCRVIQRTLFQARQLGTLGARRRDGAVGLAQVVVGAALKLLEVIVSLGVDIDLVVRAPLIVDRTVVPIGGTKTIAIVGVITIGSVTAGIIRSPPRVIIIALIIIVVEDLVDQHARTKGEQARQDHITAVVFIIVVVHHCRGRCRRHSRCRGCCGHRC
ncbi:hypothetical protein D3C76_1035100 [compost metagenome]